MLDNQRQIVSDCDIDVLKAVKEARWDDVKKFLESHIYFTDEEISLLVGKSVYAIRRWMRKCKFRRTVSHRMDKMDGGRRRRRNKFDRIYYDESWDNREWLEEHYNKLRLSIPAIAELVGHSIFMVYDRLIKYDIKLRTRTPTHRCFSPEWLAYHYGDREDYVNWARIANKSPDPKGGRCLTIKRCSEISGVARETIRNWLTIVNNMGYTIKIRDHPELCMVAKFKRTLTTIGHPDEANSTSEIRTD